MKSPTVQVSSVSGSACTQAVSKRTYWRSWLLRLTMPVLVSTPLLLK
jgi:hypothetical protein